MSSLLPAVLFLVALAGCQTAPPQAPASAPATVATLNKPGTTTIREAAVKLATPVTYAGGDGASMETAIVIQNAPNSLTGVRSEYIWLARNRPGNKRISQALLHKDGKSYDLLEIEAPDGKRQKIYFDITAFYGQH